MQTQTISSLDNSLPLCILALSLKLQYLLPLEVHGASQHPVQNLLSVLSVSIPIKPSSQHHQSHFHSSVLVVGEIRANQLGDPHVLLINLAPCSTAASLTGPTPPSSQTALGGLSSCDMPGMLLAQSRQLLSLKEPAQGSATHFENMQGKRSAPVCTTCVNGEPVKA